MGAGNEISLDTIIKAERDSLPAGSRVIEHGPVIDMHEISIISEFSPDLMHPSMDAPVIWTSASFSLIDDEDWLRASFRRLVGRHNEEWAFIHGPEYAAALAKTRAAL